MRVTMKNGSSPSPCESFAGGEVEDYTVSFVGSTTTVVGSSGEFTFNMYPNPVENILHLNFSGADKNIEVTVFNIQGKVIKRVIVENGNAELNVQNYPEGIYYVRVRSGYNLVMKRFVKM